MDLLSDILTQAGLHKKIWSGIKLPNDGSLEFPCNKSLGLHIALSEGLFLRTSKKVFALGKGDIALMARGQLHWISKSEKPTAKKHLLSDRFELKSDKLNPDLIGGAYQLWNDPIHPLFADWPDWFIIKHNEIENFEELQLIIKMLENETKNGFIGKDTIVYALMDAAFLLVLRKLLEKTSTKTQTWAQTVSDDRLRKSIEKMHAEPQREWSLEALAEISQLSKNGYTAAFKKKLGESPIQYLAKVRIQKAMRLLSDSDSNLDLIAEQVGYKDPFGFSKAFKKWTGVSPREYREQERATRASSFRFS